MAEEALPNDFDVIVIGTGLTESILAAAFTRADLSVLHVDKNDYYGANWTSFNFEAVQNWEHEHQKETEGKENKTTGDSNAKPTTANVELSENERMVELTTRTIVRNVTSAWSTSAAKSTSQEVSEPESVVDDRNEATNSSAISSSEHSATKAEKDTEETPEKSEKETEESVGKAEKTATPEPSPKEKIESQWRRFNIDLAPKILRSRGGLVNLLINSGVGRYAEFKNVDRLLCNVNDILKQVPCSRADVFQSAEISMLDKRKLMKFISLCLNEENKPENLEGCEDMPFGEFLKKNQLSPELSVYVQQALAMVPLTATTKEGVHAVRRFLQSVGRYGSSPFLWTLYGSGELPQCFCRLCAVFGGIYSLRTRVHALLAQTADTGDGDSCIGIVTDEQRINCRWVVMGPDYQLVNNKKALIRSDDKTTRIHRAVLITDRSILPDEQIKEHISLLNHYEIDGDRIQVRLLELAHGAMVCPKDFYLVHLTAESSSRTTAEMAFQRVIERYFVQSDPSVDSTDRPLILWRLYFDLDVVPNEISSFQNVAFVSCPDASMDYESAVVEARAVFTRMFPDRPFLPELPPDENNDALTEEQDVGGVNGFVPPPNTRTTTTPSLSDEDEPVSSENVKEEDNTEEITVNKHGKVTDDGE